MVYKHRHLELLIVTAWERRNEKEILRSRDEEHHMMEQSLVFTVSMCSCHAPRGSHKTLLGLVAELLTGSKNQHICLSVCLALWVINTKHTIVHWIQLLPNQNISFHSVNMSSVQTVTLNWSRMLKTSMPGPWKCVDTHTHSFCSHITRENLYISYAKLTKKKE